jgi:energy-converting hydrogenase A subunit M
VLEKSGYKVHDVMAFPIVWGKRALSKQLDLSESKIKDALNKSVMISSFSSMTLLKELQQQVVQLRALLNGNSVTSDIGVCFGMDYVVSASPTQ